MNVALKAGPRVDDDHVIFSLADPDHGYRRVTLYQEISRPRLGPDFERVDGRWDLRFPRPDADRMEYALEVERADGSSDWICDPDNPARAPGAFGDKSVVEMPGYRAPAWVTRPQPKTEVTETSIRAPALHTDLTALVWTPDGHDRMEALPLLVAHDGPEYDRYSGLLTLLAHAVADGTLPPHRVVLLGPHDRDQTYSASATYARSFAHEILPQLAELAPAPEGRTMRVGMGASLGALAMLHIHRTFPATFGALYLQSGSYFRQRFDKQESGFVRFRRIERFVGRVLTGNDWLHPIPITMTCGTVEENLANNRAVARALRAQAYEAELVENRDAHNWIAWRDVFESSLLPLLSRAWS